MCMEITPHHTIGHTWLVVAVATIRMARYSTCCHPSFFTYILPGASKSFFEPVWVFSCSKFRGKYLFHGKCNVRETLVHFPPECGETLLDVTAHYVWHVHRLSLPSPSPQLSQAANNTHTALSQKEKKGWGDTPFPHTAISLGREENLFIFSKKVKKEQVFLGEDKVCEVVVIGEDCRRCWDLAPMMMIPRRRVPKRGEGKESMRFTTKIKRAYFKGKKGWFYQELLWVRFLWNSSPPLFCV